MVFVLTLAYNRPEFVAEALINMRQSIPEDFEHVHVLVDCHYPLPDKYENQVKLSHLAKNMKSIYLRPALNRGVANNWNWAMRELEIKSGDVIVGFDPDSRIVLPDQTWLPDLCKVMEAPEAAYVGMNRHGMPQPQTKLINGVEVLDYPDLVSWSMGGFKADFVLKIGGLGQLNAQYGYIEHYCWAKMKELGMTFYLMKHHYDESLRTVDDDYHAWKLESAARKTDLDFELWLRAQGKIQ